MSSNCNPLAINVIMQVNFTIYIDNDLIKGSIEIMSILKPNLVQLSSNHVESLG